MIDSKKKKHSARVILIERYFENGQENAGMERKVNVGVVRGVPKHSPHSPASADGNVARASSGGTQSHNSSMDHLEKPYVMTSHSALDGSPSGSSDGNHHLVYPRYDPPYGRVRASPTAAPPSNGTPTTPAPGNHLHSFHSPLPIIIIRAPIYMHL